MAWGGWRSASRANPPVEPNAIRPEEEDYILEKTLQQMQLNRLHCYWVE